MKYVLISVVLFSLTIGSVFSQFKVKAQLDGGICHPLTFEKSNPFRHLEHNRPGYTYLLGASCNYQLSEKNGIYTSLKYNVRGLNHYFKSFRNARFLTNEIGFCQFRNAQKAIIYGLMNNFSLGNVNMYRSATVYNLGVFVEFN